MTIDATRKSENRRFCIAVMLVDCRYSAYLALVALVSSVAHFSAAQPTIGGHYTGKATFYGMQNGGGTCSFSLAGAFNKAWHSGIESGTAMNGPQFGGSVACGMCIMVRGCGSGLGSTPVPTTPWRYVLVTDLCSECGSGSLDLAQSGDGRWDIEWYAVQCNVGSSGFFYSFQGSNPSYFKLMIANTAVPAASVTISQPSGPVTMQRSSDNYFLATPKSGSFQLPATLTIKSVLGDTVTDTLPASALSSGSATGKAQFPLRSGYDTVSSSGSKAVASSASCGSSPKLNAKNNTAGPGVVPPPRTHSAIPPPRAHTAVAPPRTHLASSPDRTDITNAVPGVKAVLRPPPAAHTSFPRPVTPSRKHSPPPGAHKVIIPPLAATEDVSPTPEALTESVSPPPTTLIKEQPRPSLVPSTPPTPARRAPPTPQHSPATVRQSEPPPPEPIESTLETGVTKSPPVTQSATPPVMAFDSIGRRLLRVPS